MDYRATRDYAVASERAQVDRKLAMFDMCREFQLLHFRVADFLRKLKAQDGNNDGMVAVAGFKLKFTSELKASIAANVRAALCDELTPLLHRLGGLFRPHGECKAVLSDAGEMEGSIRPSEKDIMQRPLAESASFPDPNDIVALELISGDCYKKSGVFGGSSTCDSKKDELEKAAQLHYVGITTSNGNDVELGMAGELNADLSLFKQKNANEPLSYDMPFNAKNFAKKTREVDSSRSRFLVIKKREATKTDAPAVSTCRTLIRPVKRVPCLFTRLTSPFLLPTSAAYRRRHRPSAEKCNVAAD
jgi:hypothetical protein